MSADVVSDEAVETAMEEWIARTTCKTESLDSLMRAVLAAALPVIERDLRETIAQEVAESGSDVCDYLPDRWDTDDDGHTLGHRLAAADCAMAAAAARVREGGRA